MSVRLEAGDCRTIIPNLGVTVDSVVCDPPYDLVAMTKRFGKGQAAAKSQDHQRFARGFMGKEWDGQGVALDPETWRIVGSALRPGGFLLAFGAPRTHHRLASAIEDAGFVIQDCLMWLFATGFPKRRDAMKPAYEPIVVAYKPGGPRTLQVNECRIEGNGNKTFERFAGYRARDQYRTGTTGTALPSNLGRWPANIAHDGSDDVVAAFPAERPGAISNGRKGVVGTFKNGIGPAAQAPGFADNGSAARFFFSAKAQAADRWGSKHPTVKPVELMKWLVALVTPPGGVVLDPFAGSGTTGLAALATGRDCILIEREAEYLADIRERLAHYEGVGRHSLSAKARRITTPRGETPLFDLSTDRCSVPMVEASNTDASPEYNERQDSIGSFNNAITEIGIRHKAGEPIPATSRYFKARAGE